MTDGTALRPGEAPRLAYDHFRTDTLPAGEGFPVWRDAVLPLFDCAPPDAATFAATLKGYNLRETFVSICTFTELRFRRAARYAHDEGADHLLVQIYLEGGYVGDNGLTPVRVEPNDICLLDLAKPLATQALPSRVFTVVMPRDLLRSVAPKQGWRPGTVLRAGTPMGNILGHHLRTVWRNLPDASDADAPAVNRLLAGVVAGAFATETARAKTLAAPDGPATLDAIRDYILRNLNSPKLTPEHLCRHFGCSRSRLYRMFASEGGIAGVIRRARLERCRDELTNLRPGERIVDVALRWGFGSQSHFCRLFRQAFGMSPGEAVERGRAASPAARSPAAEHCRPAFHRWLRELRVA